MGAIKGYAMDFLINGGYDLEYDEDVVPKLDDMDVVLEEGVKVWEYHGKTEWEYYGVDENEGKTMP